MIGHTMSEYRQRIKKQKDVELILPYNKYISDDDYVGDVNLSLLTIL